MVNRVILVGNLCRDAEALNGARGAVTRMRLATTNTWRDADGNRQDATEFHNLVVFNRLAEICALYCMRGRRIYVEGRLRTRDYDGSDGLRRTTTEVVLDTMRLLDRREPEEPGDLLTTAAAGSTQQGATATGAVTAELSADSGRTESGDPTTTAADRAQEPSPALAGAAAG